MAKSTDTLIAMMVANAQAALDRMTMRAIAAGIPVAPKKTGPDTGADAGKTDGDLVTHSTVQNPLSWDVAPSASDLSRTKMPPRRRSFADHMADATAYGVAMTNMRQSGKSAAQDFNAAYRAQRRQRQAAASQAQAIATAMTTTVPQFAFSGLIQKDLDLIMHMMAGEDLRGPAIGEHHAPLPEHYLKVGPVAPVGAIEAYREWRPERVDVMRDVLGNGDVLTLRGLRSLSFAHPWPRLAPCVGDVTADGRMMGTPGGGIYAWKDIPNRIGSEENGLEERIFGSVYLWGDIVEHAKGYRAEYAYPKELLVLNRRQLERVKPIAEEYGIEARMLR